MPEEIRNLGILTGVPGSLIVLAMGIGRVTQAGHQDWTMFIIGGVLFLLTLPLLFGSTGRSKSRG